MSESEGAIGMLALARGDLEALKAFEGSPAIADRIFGFHAQQAIEKALKSWIALLGYEYPYTHNLLSLLALLEQHGADVGRFWVLTRYTAFAVQFRYGAFQDTGDRLDRAAVIREVAELVDHVARLIVENKPAP
jgi:HEPN domain-containing protein